MTERGVKVLREEPLEPIKDNPVASIDLNTLKSFIDIYEPKPGVARFIAKDFVNDFEKYIKQNAVETNKVQPEECPVCNINHISTAKGLCEACDPYW